MVNTGWLYKNGFIVVTDNKGNLLDPFGNRVSTSGEFPALYVAQGYWIPDPTVGHIVTVFNSDIPAENTDYVVVGIIPIPPMAERPDKVYFNEVLVMERNEGVCPLPVAQYRWVENGVGWCEQEDAPQAFDFDIILSSVALGDRSVTYQNQTKGETIQVTNSAVVKVDFDDIIELTLPRLDGLPRDFYPVSTNVNHMILTTNETYKISGKVVPERNSIAENYIEVYIKDI